VFTVTVCVAGAAPPTVALNKSGVVGDRTSAGQALVPVPGHTAAILGVVVLVTLMASVVTSPTKVKPAPVGVYVAVVLGPTVRAVNGNASGTAAGKPAANSTSDENDTPPAAAKVHPLRTTVSLAPVVTFTVGGVVKVVLGQVNPEENAGMEALKLAGYELVEPV
jgi:hypothetical protein